MRTTINKSELNEVLMMLDGYDFFEIDTDYFKCGKEDDEYYLYRRSGKYDITTTGEDIDVIGRTLRSNNIIDTIPDDIEIDVTVCKK